jgi:Zn ribbon nucleic-acid-binding protein
MKSEKEIVGADQGIECIQTICLSEKSTECVCPKCGARHKVKMLWTGRGIPRKFCPICKHYATSINDVEPCKVSSLVV